MTQPFLQSAFCFSVSLSGTSGPISDVVFQEVSGLETSVDMETVIEGGANRFVHQLPKPAKASNLKLKRGLTTSDSDLVKWCRANLEGSFVEEIDVKTLTISLLDETGEPVARWSLNHAYPVRWSIGAFDAMKNEVAVESIEVAYTTLTREL